MEHVTTEGAQNPSGCDPGRWLEERTERLAQGWARVLVAEYHRKRRKKELAEDASAQRGGEMER
jgi:hypothetical protein